MAFLDGAREHGVEVTWDQYPYTAWGSGLIDYLPHWVVADGREKLVERLHNKTVRQAIREEIEQDVRREQHPLCAAPWETVRIALVESPAGKMCGQIMAPPSQRPSERGNPKS